MAPIHFSSECVVEASGRRVSDGESWRDPSNACIACTCQVIWGRARGGGVDHIDGPREERGASFSKYRVFEGLRHLCWGKELTAGFFKKNF